MWIMIVFFIGFENDMHMYELVDFIYSYLQGME